jgi:hypothetical protein
MTFGEKLGALFGWRKASGMGTFCRGPGWANFSEETSSVVGTIVEIVSAFWQRAERRLSFSDGPLSPRSG